jgi:hypothetical protein
VVTYGCHVTHVITFLKKRSQHKNNTNVIENFVVVYGMLELFRQALFRQALFRRYPRPTLFLLTVTLGFRQFGLGLACVGITTVGIMPWNRCILYSIRR